MMGNSNSVAVIGHRANSWRIVRLYKLIKVPLVEIDVSNDGKGGLMVKHGPSEIKRASVIGQVFSYIDYKFFYRDPLIKASRIENHLRMLRGFSGVLFDVKRNINLKALAEVIDDLQPVYGINYAYVSTPYHPLIKDLKGLTRNAICAATLHDLPVDPVMTVTMAEADAVSANYTLITTEFVEALHAIGVKVMAWTVNDCETALKLVNDGVDAIITDKPDAIIKCLRRSGVSIRDYV